MRRLLIVGAGEYGHVVRELALQVGYEKVEFLDDNSPIAVGKVSEFGGLLVSSMSLLWLLGVLRCAGPVSRSWLGHLS